MRTAVSIYILIPLLLVPMLLLGGAMIRFDDLHKSLSRKTYVPVIGDLMVTRWAYEAMMVEQFKNNRFEKPFFEYDMKISELDWKASFLIPTLKVKINEIKASGKNPEYEDYTRSNIRKVNYHIRELFALTGISPDNWIDKMNYDDFIDYIGDEAKSYLDNLSPWLRKESRSISANRDSVYNQLLMGIGEEQFQELRNRNYNENVANIVLNRLSTNKICDSEKKLLQKADPVFMKPGSKKGRAHFYAPYKQLGNMKIDTLIFNVLFIWAMTLALFVSLCYDLLKKFVFFLESLRIPIWRKFGREMLRT